MYSRFEPRIADSMTCVARVMATTIAGAVLFVGGRQFFQSEMGGAEILPLVYAIFAASAFLALWRFELLGAFISVLAAFWIVSREFVQTDMPDFMALVLLLPALLSLGAWMRRTEYRVVSEIRQTAQEK